jgi:hypothetical protein
MFTRPYIDVCIETSSGALIHALMEYSQIKIFPVNRLETIMQAKPITTDPVILRTNARRSRSLAAQIDVLNESIKNYDAEIKELVKKHSDYEIVKNLPGASDKTHARIIAALGDDRNRYASPLRWQSERWHSSGFESSSDYGNRGSATTIHTMSLD